MISAGFREVNVNHSNLASGLSLPKGLSVHVALWQSLGV